jgi:hypothetical protein
MFSRRKPVSILLVIVSVVLVSGCETGPFLRDRQAPQGAVTTATAPEGLESSAIGWSPSLVEAEEIDLVEEVLDHRALYHRALRQLRDYYEKKGYAVKQSWAEFELKGLRSVKPFRYLLDAEIPADSLKPARQVAEADALYAEALDLMKRGGHGIPALCNQDLMVRAAAKLRQLVEEHPSSDKIDDAAFYMGEIHKEYFADQEPIAVRWYERAWNWDPTTPHPARFQAAVVYDYRLHDRARALELYHSVLAHETGDEKNIRFATRRIRELSTELSQAEIHRQ